MYLQSRVSVRIGLILGALSLGVFTTTLYNQNSIAAETNPTNIGQRSGAAVYAQMCSRCHGPDGRANTAKGRSVGATDFTSNDWVPNVARDRRIVTRGRESMPAFKQRLRPAEIRAVVNYIRRFK